VVIHDKPYALCCKFFEYTFEPVIYPNSKLFYEMKFNNFIATILYWGYITDDKIIVKIISEFQTFMKNKDFKSFKNKLQNLFNFSLKHKSEKDPINQIIHFIISNSDKINSEIVKLKDNSIGKWILELTNTSLFRILCYWSEKYDNLKVYCDISKPIKENIEFWNLFIKKKDKRYIDFREEKRKINFNLSHPVELLNSRSSYGIQTADTIASFIEQRLKLNENDIKQFQNMIIISDSVLPLEEDIDLTQ